MNRTPRLISGLAIVLLTLFLGEFMALFFPVSYILSTFSSPYSRTETVVGLLVLNGIGLSVSPEMNSADGRDLLFWLPLGSKKVEENGKQTLCWELAL